MNQELVISYFWSICPLLECEEVREGERILTVEAEVQNKPVSWQLCTFAFLFLYQVLWYSGTQSQQQLQILMLKKI